MSGVDVGSAYMTIIPSAKGFASKLQAGVGGDIAQVASRGGKDFGDKFSQSGAAGLRSKAAGMFAGFAKAGVLGIAGAAVAVGKVLFDSIGEAREAQVVGARTANVIKSMGNASKITASQVGDLATALSNKAGIDDEAIQSGENLLLTFGNIRNEAGKGNDIFSQTSGLMVDMSVAMGQDMNSSAIQLGKALNDPIKGVSALSRVGVSFSQQQKDTIKKLTESGKALDAQKIILGEVKKQFGGAAEAMASPADKAKVAWGNFQEAIGTAILPLVDKLLTAFANALPAVLSWLGKMKTSLAPVGAALKTAGSAVVGFLAGFKSGGGASQVSAIFSNLAAVFTGKILPAARSLIGYVASNVVPIFRAVVQIVRQNVIPVVLSLARFFTGTLLPAVVAIYQHIAAKLRPVFDAIYGVILSRVVPAVALITAKFREWQPTIQRVISVVVLIVGKILEFAAAILGKVLPPVIRFAGWLITGLVKALIVTIETVAKIVGAVIQFGVTLFNAGATVVSFVKNAGSTIIGFFTGLPAKIGNVAGTLLAKGKDLVVGLGKGVASAAVGFFLWWVRLPLVVLTKIGNVASTLARKGGDLIRGLLSGIGSAAVGLWNWWVNLRSTVYAKIGNVASTLLAKGKDLIGGLKSGITTGATAAYTFLTGLPKTLADKLGNLKDKLLQKGKDLIQGLIDGITSKIKDIGDAMGKIGKTIADHLPGSPVKRGPLRSWNNGAAGKRLIGDLLAPGLLAGIPAIEAAMSTVAGSIQATGTLSASAATAAGAAAGPADTYVTVLLDGEPVRAIVKAENREARRGQRRAVTSRAA